MKVRETKTQIIKTEDYEETYFGIDNDEDLVQIFSILRSKIYTDKVKAVIREYSTNAQDAHVDVGTPDRKIDVQVPSKFAPEFSVRDYGPGLTDEAVRSIYVKYGKSTKRDSNSYNGQLGLGCKAGFAYGDSYLITSYKDGVETSFEAYIDETKIGKVAKLEAKETSEPNGMKITIPVRTGDVEAFLNTAKDFYKYFTPIPNIPGLTIVPPKYNYSGNGWGLSNTQKHGYHGSYTAPRAVMGNINYPIDMDLLQKSTPYEHWAKVSHLKDVGTVLTFDIGDLSIASSREGLEYDKPTIKNIIAKLELVVKELAVELQKSFENIKDIFEAREKWEECFGYRSDRSIQRLMPDAEIVWNGIKITSAQFKHNTKTDSLKAIQVTADSHKVSGVSQFALGRYMSWTHRSSIAYIINDAEGKWILRTRNYFAQNPDIKSCMVFKLEEPAATSKKAFETLLKETGLEEKHFIKLSTIEPLKITRASKVVLPKHKAKIFEFDCTANGTKASDCWTVSAVDIKKSASTYVTLSRFVPSFAGEPQTRASLSKILNAVYAITGEDLSDELYGVKKSVDTKIAKTWVKLEDRIQEVLEKELGKSELATMLAAQRVVHSHDEIVSYLQTEELWDEIEAEKDSPLDLLLTTLKNYNQISSKDQRKMEAIKTILGSLTTLNLEPEIEKKMAEHRKNIESINATYSMFKHAVSYSRPTTEEIKNYLSMVSPRSN